MRQKVMLSSPLSFPLSNRICKTEFSILFERCFTGEEALEIAPERFVVQLMSEHSVCVCFIVDSTQTVYKITLSSPLRTSACLLSNRIQMAVTGLVCIRPVDREMKSARYKRTVNGGLLDMLSFAIETRAVLETSPNYLLING